MGGAHFALETDVLLLKRGALAENAAAPQHAADRTVRAADRHQRQHVVEQQQHQMVPTRTRPRKSVIAFKTFTHSLAVLNSFSTIR